MFINPPSDNTMEPRIWAPAQNNEVQGANRGLDNYRTWFSLDTALGVMAIPVFGVLVAFVEPRSYKWLIFSGLVVLLGLGWSIAGTVSCRKKAMALLDALLENGTAVRVNGRLYQVLEMHLWLKYDYSLEILLDANFEPYDAAMGGYTRENIHLQHEYYKTTTRPEQLAIHTRIVESATEAAAKLAALYRAQHQ